jgi:hypothetical protein
METVFQTPINNEDELANARNKIKELEEKIKWLECDIKENKETISAIEMNMTSQYVEDWTVTDNNGKGRFSGNMYWIKGGGMVFYENNTIFQGDWDSTGEITEGELRGTHSDELLAKWEDGEEIDLEKEDEYDS